MDVRTTRLVVGALAALCCISLLGSILLTAMGIQPPSALGSIIGTTFGVLIGLPIVPRAEKESANRTVRQPPHQTGLILAIDDSEGIRLVLQQVLGEAGYTVRTVATAEEALQLIRTGFRPDLILLDMVLPGMNGNSFLSALKARKDDFPVIVLSAWPEQLESEVAGQVTMTLKKPPNVAELVQVIGSYLRKRSA